MRLQGLKCRMNDYERIAAVIRYLDEHHGAQPSLALLAGQAGLSESHFHRLFHRWAGVTPKDFLPCLSAGFTKRRLRESANVLDAARDAGLSGAGRLHDPLVTLEAASPGEIKTGGVGLRIQWGTAESPFGSCSLGWTARGWCHLAFHDLPGRNEPPEELKANWHGAHLVCSEREARTRAVEIFSPGLQKTPLRAFVRGTPFQVKVWQALLQIPSGSLSTYGRIAQAIEARGANRAVGTACGRNPIAFLIPCHRVIRETGLMQGYRWGTFRKQAMLGWEAASWSRNPSSAVAR